jgi:hypothetical protein
MRRLRPVRSRAVALTAAAGLRGVAVVGTPDTAGAGPTTVTQTFSYTGSTATFTVPAGITLDGSRTTMTVGMIATGPPTAPRTTATPAPIRHHAWWWWLPPVVALATALLLMGRRRRT